MFECTAKLDFSQWMKRRGEVLQRNEVVKIGNVDLFPEEAAEAYERGLYIVAFRRVYQVNYSAAQGRYYGQEVYYSADSLPLTRRGRYFSMSAAEVNRLIGHELMN